jgi:1-deoxy-D-xylulose-5-phosphate synthase
MVHDSSPLSRIHCPADLLRLTDAELDEVALAIRNLLKQVVSTNGGHLASNLGVVELTLALHRVFDFSQDRLVFDVGHQAYVHKLVTGRAARFSTLRTEGGLSGFPDPAEHPDDVIKVGHSSAAISTALGLAEGYRRQGLNRKAVALVGDGALTGGMSFEALINGGHSKADLLVILNDNGNFIDAPVGSLHGYFDRIRSGRVFNHLRDRLARMIKRVPGGMSLERMAETAEAAARRLVSPGYLFEDLGWRYFGPLDGTNRVEIEAHLKQIKDLKEPVILHVHTHKGQGWEPSRRDPLRFHGPRHYDPDTGVFPAVSEVKPSYNQVFAETLETMMRQDSRLIAITAAMPTGTGLSRIMAHLPERVIDVGICEQHSFGLAEGLSIAGLRPVLAHYSTFAQRGFDQLFQELVLQRSLGVIVVLDRGGLVGEDGETHQGIYDLSWAGCLPLVTMLSPRSGPELSAMLAWAHEHGQGPDRSAAYLIRYPKEEVPELPWPAPAPIQYGRAEVVRSATEEKSLQIWALGPMAAKAWNAIASLPSELAAHCTLVNPRFVKPLDTALLQRLSTSHPMVLSLEDHALEGGLGSRIASAIQDQNLPCRLTRVGVPDRLIPHATRAQQLARCGLDEAAIAAQITKLLSPLG